jgi:hypothetical protein
MAQTAANLVERTLPKVPLRQWVLTLPFELRYRAAFDKELIGAIHRIFVQTLFTFYARSNGGRGGALSVVQRASGDLKLNPHLHTVALDGVFVEQSGELVFHALPHLRTRDVQDVLHRTVKRVVRHLKKRGVLTQDDALAEQEPALAHLAAASVSGEPPCGPELRRLPPITLRRDEPRIVGPLSATESGFSIHAATHAGANDDRGREALIRYVLRPPIANERITTGSDGLVRIALKRPFADGTIAVDMDPLSLLSRLAAMVPPPYFHTVRYSGVLASHSAWRPRILLQPPVAKHAHEEKKCSSTYWPWAELMKRSFAIDVETCPACGKRLKLVSLVHNRRSITRMLRSLDEPTDPPTRSPPRGPPFWQSRVLRRSFAA